MHKINVEDNLNIVWDVINKDFGGSANKRLKFSGLDKDDLFQIGCIGLMKAVERFDEARNNSFYTYAKTLIKGEIMHEFRDKGRQVKFPRGVLEAVASISVNGKKDTITIDEVMETYNVDRNYASMIITCLFYHTASGNAVLQDSEGDTENTLFDVMGDESVNVEQEVLMPIELEERLSVLNDHEREVVELSLKGLTQSQVADIVGVSQMQVSRLIKKSLKKIENMFDKRFAV